MNSVLNHLSNSPENDHSILIETSSCLPPGSFSETTTTPRESVMYIVVFANLTRLYYHNLKVY